MASVKMPTSAELAKVGTELGMNLSDSDIAFFLETFSGNVAAYNLLDTLPDDLPPVKYPRTPGYQPEGEENKYNLWYRKSEIKGAPDGKLKGKKVVLKDNVCVAGVPMMNGASTLEGYVPDVDATIVTRMLDAGATIVGKVTLRIFLLLRRQPHQRARARSTIRASTGYSAGGSSSGSAALVAAGEVDMAIGGDQGGSIRMPASYCGIVRHEADPRPRAVHRRDADRADARSHRADDRHRRRQRADAGSARRTGRARSAPDGAARRTPTRKALGGGASGLRIGVVKEGFGHPQSEQEVDDLVKKAAEMFRQLGAEVEEVSIPMHLAGVAIWSAIAVEGATWQMMQGNGYGFNWKGLYVTSLVDCPRRLARARRRAVRHAEDHDPDRQVCARASIAATTTPRRRTSRASSPPPTTRALADYDLLLMPTLPLRATRLPDPARPAHGDHQRAPSRCCPTPRRSTSPATRR